MKINQSYPRGITEKFFRNTSWYVILACTIFISCNGIKTKVHPFIVAGSFERIEPASGVEIIDATDPLVLFPDKLKEITDSVIYIQLDNRELIGAINKVIVHGGSLYILDSFVTKKVFVFDMEGNFIRTVSNIGRGPNEYMGVSDIIIREDSSFIVLYDHRSIQKLVFDLEGNFIRREPPVPAYYIEHIDDAYLNQMGYMQSMDKDQNYMLVATEGDSTYITSFPFLPFQKNDWMKRSMTRNWKNEILFTPIYYDTVYHINSKNTYTPRFVVKLKNSISSKLSENPTDHSDLLRKGYTMLGGKVLETEKYLFFIVSKPYNDGRILSSHYLYDKEEKVCYEFPNSLNITEEYRPKDPRTSIDQLTFGTPVNLYGNFFVSAINMNEWKVQFEEGKKNGWDYIIRDQHLQEIYEKTGADSNPVIALTLLK